MVSVVITDYLKPYFKWSDSRYEITSKVLTACLGLVIIGTGFLASILGEILIVTIGIVGSFYGAYIGIFLMGIWMPFINSWGAIFGFLCGVMGSFVAFLGGRAFVKPQYLTRKLPVSTLICPTQCGYLDSMNMTTAYTMTSIDLTRSMPTVSYYSSTNDEQEMSIIQNVFSLSVFYTPAIGLLYSVLTGITISLLTGGWENRNLVDKATIDPISFARLRRCMPVKLRDLCACRNAGNDSRDDDEHNHKTEAKDEEHILLSTI